MPQEVLIAIAIYSLFATIVLDYAIQSNKKTKNQ